MILYHQLVDTFAKRFVLTAVVIGCVFTCADAAILSNQLFKLTASDASAEDAFGQAVAVSGNLVVVGASGDDHPRMSGATDDNAGSAYVFDLMTGQQLFKLTPSDATEGDRFGDSIAISNNMAIIGAYLDDDGGNVSGSAYLFDATTGNQRFKLVASDAAALDLFGTSVAISDEVAIVGAPGDDEGAPGAGSAYLFNATTGQQLLKLTASDPAESNGFGTSVAVSGNHAIVGSPRNDDAGTNSGSAYLFDVTGGQELFKLAPTDSTAFDAFGNSVALSGNIAIVGAYIKDGAGNSSGAAYLFDVTTGQQLHKLTNSDTSPEDHFGFSVAISGNLALVGTYRDLAVNNPTPRADSVYLFDVTTGQQFAQHSTGAIDGFGHSVAIDGLSEVVGASWDSETLDGSGSAYVFVVVPEPASISMAGLCVTLLLPSALRRHSIMRRRAPL